MKRTQTKGNNEQDQEIEIPIDNLSGVFSLLEGKMEQRKIYLFEDICPESVVNVISQIHFLEEKDPNEDIELYINSDGGFVLDGLALIDVMNSCSCDIKVFVIGRAASAACLIASNGTEGKRYMGKNSECMYHQSYSDLPDVKLTDIEYWKKEISRIQDKCNRIFSKNTKQSIETIGEMFFSGGKDRWMTASEAKKFGIVDKIMKTKNR